MDYIISAYFVPSASRRPMQTKIHHYLAHNLILLNENRNKGENQVSVCKDGTTEAALTWSSRLHLNLKKANSLNRLIYNTFPLY